MRRIRYLSGNQAGAEHDIPDTEAENLIASGFAQDASSTPPPSLLPPAPAAPETAPKPKRIRKPKTPKSAVAAPTAPAKKAKTSKKRGR